MTLHEWLKPHGAKKAFCRQMNISTTTLWNWLSGRQRIPQARCMQIYDLLQGQIDLVEIRPDLNWGYLTAQRKEDSNAKPVQRV